MRNDQIADVFDEMADLLEIDGESPFRVRAYRNGSQIIRDLSDSVSQWIRDGRDLATIDGIGSTLAEKSKILVTQGELPQLQKLRDKVPPSLRKLLLIPGLGAKKVGALFKELGVRDLHDLRIACESNRVQELKGFGAKTQKSILDGLAIAEQANRRLTRDVAERLVESLRIHLSACQAILKFDFAGSYRRGKETVGDLDVLAVSDRPLEAMAHFVAFPDTREIILQGPTKSSIRVTDAFQVDLRVVPEDSWGAALQYFTGSKEHNVVLRGIAKKLGLRLNEYSLASIDDESKVVAGADEVGIYRSLGLPFVSPEFRENRFEWSEAFERIAAGAVTLADIRGDLHMHTTATDGENSIEEMVAAAQSLGLQYIAITDHSQRVSVVRGLNAERVLEQWEAIDRFNAAHDTEKFLVLKGIECDILEDGTMDLPDDVLSKSDWVMASIHFGQKQSRDEITQRILNAIRHPSVTAISHPTGRLLNRREAYEVDLDSIFQAAVKHNKFLEINANPWRLDLSDVHAMGAATHGVEFVINTDAHSIANLGLMKFGIQVARRAGLQRGQVFNCKSLAEVKLWLEQRRSSLTG
jgi:DNA polymerase (family X)